MNLGCKEIGRNIVESEIDLSLVKNQAYMRKNETATAPVVGILRGIRPEAHGCRECMSRLARRMVSNSEVVLIIGTQKHDPAWKHCLMVCSGDRTKLKCMYCLKQFLCGDIHRIKEHRARHKGNASCCHKVPPEVQVAMQQSLDSTAIRKKKKQKLTEVVGKWIPPDPPKHLPRMFAKKRSISWSSPQL